MRGRTWLLAAALVLPGAVGASGLHAQEVDREGRTLPDTTTSTAARDTLPARLPAPYIPPRFSLSLSLGRPGIGALQGQGVLAERRTAGGEVLESATLAREIEAEGGFQVRADAIASLTHAWAVRAGVGLGRADLGTGYDGEDDTFVAAAEALAGREETTLSVLSIDAALRLRIPSSHRAQPYIELGGAALRWQADDPPAGAEALERGVRRMAVMGAAGAVVPITGRLAAGLRLAARVSRTPISPAEGGEAGVSSSTLALTFEPPLARPYLDAGHALITTLLLDVGLSVRFGAVPPPPPNRSEPAAPPERRRR